MSVHLVYRPIMQKDESPGSVLIRTSFYNGYTSPMQLINWSRVTDRLPSSIRQLLRNGEYFTTASKLIGIKLTLDTGPVIPKKHGMTRQFFYGVNMREERLRNHFSYCPLCLDELRYHKRFWDHEYIKVCSQHKVRIIEACESCDSPIQWNRKSLFECQCENSLLNTKASHSNSIVEDYLQEVFINSDQDAFDDFEEMFQALSRFFGKSRPSREIQEITVNGLDSPEVLSDILVSELLKDPETLKYHPKLTMIDFALATGKQIKQVSHLVSEKFHAYANTESYFSYNGDLLDYTTVGEILGITSSQAAELRRSKALKGYQITPGTPFNIEQASLHVLLFRLGALPIHSLKQSVSIEDCLNDSALELALSQILNGVLNESIKLVHFSWSAPLLSIRIEKQQPRFSSVEVYDLVPLKAFVEFIGLHTNDVREAIRESEDVEYFNHGHTHGGQKYLTLDCAENLTHVLKHRFHKPSKVDGIWSRCEKSKIPAESIEVYFE